MIAVIFEVEPAPGQCDTCLNLAARLKPLFEQVDGFISVERFQSTTNPDRILSLSLFRDEEAVKARRSLEQHRGAQHVGRDRAFADYRLYIAHVVRGYGMTSHDEAPTDSRAEHV